MNLTQKTAKGVMWTGIGQFIAQFLQFVVKITLARLLFPEDFGVIGMALIFIAFIQIVNELGLSAAIIQRKDINERHLSTSFWMSILAGVVLCTLVIGLSPFIAIFFKKEILRSIVSVLSMGFILGSFGIVHGALLAKEIDFRNLAIVEIGAAIFTGVVSISLAVFGFGVWSLVIGSLVGNFTRSAFLWMRCSWRPTAIFDFKSFKELFLFGKNVMGSRILNYFDSNVAYLLIAKFLDVTSLGLYTLAYQMAVFPLLRISSIITRVTFPSFSTIQDDNAKLRKGYVKAIKYTSLIAFPLLAGLAVVAPEFIAIVIGEKWKPMVLPLQILCIAGALNSIGTHVGSILLSKGRSDIQFKWNIFTAIVLPVAILIGIKYGINGVAMAVAIMTCSLFLIIQKISNKLIDLSFHVFFKALYPATICSGILVTSVLVFQKLTKFIFLQEIVALISSIIIGAVSYIVAILIIDNYIFKEIKVLVRQAGGK